MEKRIFIVDDEKDLLEILTYHFELDGWTVRTALSAKSALEEMALFKPEVVISDINMPGIDGIEMVHRLQINDPEIPVILITGYRDVEKMKRAWSACVFDFIDKPFDQKQLTVLANNAREHGREYVRFARQRFNKMKKGAA